MDKSYLGIEEVKQLSKWDYVKIVDYRTDTTNPPRVTECHCVVMKNDDKQLVVAGRGYSFYQYSDYGTKWVAHKAMPGGV